MRIGVDIDGVLAEVEQYKNDYFPKFLVENNISYSTKEYSYNLNESFGVDEKVEDAFWDEYYDDYCKNVKVKAFASEVLKKLKAEGNEIYIISARWNANEQSEYGAKIRGYVRDWLKSNDIVYDELIFNKEGDGHKVPEIKQYKIDVMIEDYPVNIRAISKLIPVICYDCRGNAKLRGKNIIRCYSWYDVYHKIHTEIIHK